MLNKYMKELFLTPFISFNIPLTKLQETFENIIDLSTGIQTKVMLYADEETLQIGTRITNDLTDEQYEQVGFFINPQEDWISTDILIHHMLGLKEHDDHKRIISIYAVDNTAEQIEIRMKLEDYKYILYKRGITLIEIPSLIESKYFLKCVDNSWNKHMSIKGNDGQILSFEFNPDNYPSSAFSTYLNETEYNVAIEEVDWMKDHDSEGVED